MAATVAGILLTGVHGSRPTSGVSVGTLYSCTTHSLVYQTSDTGSTWATWATLTGTGYTPGGTDVAVADGGTGASTASAARTNLGLVIGTDVAAFAAGIPRGTSNPGSPASGDPFFRTDLNLIIKYDGTRWLCTCAHHLDIGISDALAPITATAGALGRATLPFSGEWAIVIDTVSTMFEVGGGGSALDASNKWVGTVNDEGGTIATININSGASSSVRLDTQAVNSLRASTSKRIYHGWTKTGTPGGLYAFPSIHFRLVIT